MKTRDYILLALALPVASIIGVSTALGLWELVMIQVLGRGLGIH